MTAEFPALTGFYRLLFLYIEVRIFQWIRRKRLNAKTQPGSTILPAILVWLKPGAAWFHSELVPGAQGVNELDSRTRMAILQLASCTHVLLLKV
jgi:hypothetical protein